MFDSLLSALSILQLEAHESTISGNKKKQNKALAAFPCGLLNVEEVASVAMRLLRINSATSPKQVRADKIAYEELMQVHLQDLHCLAWKINSFLFKNVEMGTEIFERELATLTRDQMKSDLKTMEKLGKGSERALDQFIELIKLSASFNGQVFVNEIVRSGILLEISSKATQKFSSLLRSGGTERENVSSSNKKARYHQVSESDQKRLEKAQKAFCLELEQAFSALSRNFVVFDSAYGHLSPQEHVSLTENILSSILVIFQSQHNFKFVPEIFEGEYLRILVDLLNFALISFQPAYLPPFLPISIRILNLIAGKSGAAGLSARRALLQVELMIHPRRLGPVTFRPASEAIIKLFERIEPPHEEVIKNNSANQDEIPEEVKEKEIEVIDIFMTEAIYSESIASKEEFTEDPKAVEYVEVEVPKAVEEPKSVEFTGELKVVKVKPIEAIISQQVKPAIMLDSGDSDDDLPLPQIVDSGPDDN